jgi:hypothetical protein
MPNLPTRVVLFLSSYTPLFLIMAVKYGLSNGSQHRHCLPDQCLHPYNPGMAEWIKILLSTLSGLAIGLLSALVFEPVKQDIIRRRTARRAEKAIYQEIGELHYMLDLLSSFPDSHNKLPIRRMRFEVFDYYYGQHREAFYSIPRHAEIRSVYSQFELLLQDARQGKVGPSATMRELKEAIDYSIDCGGLDGERLKAIADTYKEEIGKHTGTFIDYLQKGMDR